MGQVLHGSATTTEAIRRAIQNSQESLRALSKRYGINQKTVAKWKKRTSVADVPTGPKNPSSTVLTIEEEAVIIAFRRHTLLPLDDCLYALQPTIPNLTRSSLHRCLRRHGISRLPDVEGDKPAKKKFKSYPIGYVHIDIAEVQTAEGKLYLFVAIDRTSKFAYVELHKRATKMIAVEFLRHLIQALPYQIHTILTDNGIQFKNREQDRTAMEHIFGRTCRENGIEQRTTKVKHPWTNGQVERMNRTIKEATVRRFHYDSHDQLQSHLADFIAAYNFGRRLKTLKGLSPVEFIYKQWTIEPQRFRLNPLHQMPGLNNYSLLYFATSLLSGMTLGWSTPAMNLNLQERMTGDMRIGTMPFRFRGRAGPLYGPYAVCWGISLVALILLAALIGFTIYGFGDWLKTILDDTPGAAFSILIVFAFFAGFFIFGALYAMIWAFYTAREIAIFASYTTLDKARFRIDATGWSLIGLIVGNLLLVIFTLGIATPFAQQRLVRYFCGRMSVQGTVDIDRIMQSREAVGRTGEGLADAFDVGGI